MEGSRSDISEIVSTNEVALAPLKIPIGDSAEKSHNIPDEETKQSHVAPEHELRTSSVEESRILAAEESQVPAVFTVSAKEHQMLHEKESEILPKLMMQNQASDVKLHVSSMNESSDTISDSAATDIVTAAEIEVNHTKELTDKSEKRPVTISDAKNDSERNSDTERKISHDTSEQKNSSNVITWIATGKTVVSMQTEKV